MLSQKEAYKVAKRVKDGLNSSKMEYINKTIEGVSRDGRTECSIKLYEDINGYTYFKGLKKLGYLCTFNKEENTIDIYWGSKPSLFNRLSNWIMSF